jgi:DNA repair photolyase
MNIYRGCSHGCIYCDSRSRCYGFTHAFEDIEVKENAPELLENPLPFLCTVLPVPET